MKRLLILAVGSGLGLGLLLCLLGWWFWTRSCPLPDSDGSGGPTATVVVRIHPGMTLSAAADTLIGKGLLANRTVLLLGARLTGQDRGLRAGLFELNTGLSPRDLLEDLVSGLSVQIRVTVPEGLGSNEVAEILSGTMGFSPEAFLAVADSLVREEMLHGKLLSVWDQKPGATGNFRFSRLDSLLAHAHGQALRPLHWCEGYLAPDTYLFGEGTPPLTVARHLVDTQMTRLGEAGRSMRSDGPAQNLHQLLSLASLVESEARLVEERTLVAAVYSNRLVRKWRLEADPTVAFALAKKGRRLYYKDLKVDSPYNTYRFPGLPPGPIANPGNSALMAAARPDSLCDAMYFVSDGQGGHVFSRTIQEHEEAVRRFRKIRAEGARR